MIWSLLVSKSKSSSKLVSPKYEEEPNNLYRRRVYVYVYKVVVKELCVALESSAVDGSGDDEGSKWKNSTVNGNNDGSFYSSYSI